MKTNQDLDADQDPFRDAVETFNHDVIVVANAGSGKTKLLVDHYFALLLEGFEPTQILTFTFTEKAAKELKERIYGGLSKNPSFQELGATWIGEWFQKIKDSSIGTIHQFCLTVLKEANDHNHFENYQIIDAATHTQLWETRLKSSIKAYLEKTDPRAEKLLKAYGIGNFYNLLRSMSQNSSQETSLENRELPDLETLEKDLLTDLLSLSAEINERIALDKSRKGWLSFDDLEQKALRLISNPTEALSKYLNRFRHILIDEFQDTSPIQIRIIDALRTGNKPKGLHPRVFCVGDPKQSIYRFRNVDRNLIHAMEAKVLSGGGRHFDFTNNYRSTPKIVHFLNQYTKFAFPDAKPSSPVRKDTENTEVNIYTLPLDSKKPSVEESRAVDAFLISSQIKKLQNSRYPLNEVAVLYRASSSAIPLIQQLKKNDVPYSVRGGQELLERQEILDFKNLLYFLANPEEEIPLVGILRSPIFFISDISLFFVKGSFPKDNLFQIFSEDRHQDILKKKFPEELPKIQWALSMLQELIQQSKTCNPYILLREMVDTHNLGNLYAEALQDTDALLAIEQWLDWLKQLIEENPPMGIEGLVRLLKQIDKTPINKAPLGDILGQEDCVNLLTIHAAKGLQFETVFLLDLNRRPPSSSKLIQSLGNRHALKTIDSEGNRLESPRFQAIKAFHEEEELEENKRLLYVALSRTKNNLWVALSPIKQGKTNLQGLLTAALGDENSALPLSGTSKGQDPTSPLPGVQDPRGIPEYISTKELTPLPLLSTVSELETFAACPLKHHYKYNQQISDEDWELNFEMNTTQMGTLLHTALHSLHRLPDLSSTEIIKRIASNYALWTQEETLAKLGHLLEKFMGGPQYQKILQADEDYSELPFILNFKNGKIRGQIDRLIRLKSKWILIDFKLVSHSTPETKILKNYSFQLKTYALAVQKILKGEIPEVEIQLLGSPKTYSINFSEHQLSQHRQSIEELLLSFSQPNLEQVRFQEVCYSCPFNRAIPLCPIPRREA